MSSVQTLLQMRFLVLQHEKPTAFCLTLKLQQAKQLDSSASVPSEESVAQSRVDVNKNARRSCRAARTSAFTFRVPVAGTR